MSEKTYGSSYRNPRQVLDRKYANINAGLKNMFKSIGNTAADFNKYKKLKETAAKATLNKRMGSYEKAEAAFRQLALDVGDDVVSEEERQSYTAQVEENLKLIRDNLAKELGNQDLSNSQIAQYQSLALRDLNTFKTQITQWQAATNEYEEAKKRKWNEQGALLPGKNNESIEMLGSIMDDGKENFFLFNRKGADYTLGSGNWAIGMMDDITTPGAIPNMTNVVMFDELVKTPDDQGFFNTTGGLSDEALKGFKGTIDGFIKNKDERFITDGKIDKQKLTDYLSTNPDGEKLLKSMFDNPNDPQDKSNYLGYLRGKAGAMTQDVEDLAALDEQMLGNTSLLIESLIKDAYPFEQLDRMEIKTDDKDDEDNKPKGGKGNQLTNIVNKTTTTTAKKEQEPLPEPKTDAQKKAKAAIEKAQAELNKYEEAIKKAKGVVEGDDLEKINELEDRIKKSKEKYIKSVNK
jgi:hypothetical protein